MSQPKKVKSVCVPIDPDDCGSVISGYVRFPELYRTHYGKKLWDVNWGASITLSDCNRVIQWDLTGNAYNIAKLDAAINALTKMRALMCDAQNELAETKGEKNRLNKVIDPDYRVDDED